jgi:hypothetical protein
MIYQTLGAIAAGDPDKFWRPNYKALSVFLPYAVWLDRNGNREMLNALLRAARADAGLIWYRAGPFIHTLFNEASPRITVLVSPHVNWQLFKDGESLVSQWVAAASVIPHTEEVGQSVVDTLLLIVALDSLPPSIPIDIWACLEKRPLPPQSIGRQHGAWRNVVSHIRALGNNEILKSYFLLVWSELYELRSGGGLTEMQVSIQQDFSGLGMERHRKDLIERLDHVLWGLDQGVKYIKQGNPRINEQEIQWAKEDYTTLKEVLLEVDREATKILNRMSPRMIILSGC